MGSVINLLCLEHTFMHDLLMTHNTIKDTSPLFYSKIHIQRFLKWQDNKINKYRKLLENYWAIGRKQKKR